MRNILLFCLVTYRPGTASVKKLQRGAKVTISVELQQFISLQQECV